VGAAQLADACAALEVAGKGDDWDTIESLAPTLGPMFDDIEGFIRAL